MGKIRKSITKTIVLVIIALFIFPMLNLSSTVHAAETYNFVLKWGSASSGGGQFNTLDGIAVDNAGYVYVADINNNYILKFTGDGVFVTKWGGFGSDDGQFNVAFSNGMSLAVDNSGYIYATDSGNRRVQKFTTNGTYVTQWAGSWSIGARVDIAVDNRGYIYLDDAGSSYIQKFTDDGVFVTQWGGWGSGDGQFMISTGIGVDNSGYVYVVDVFNKRIQKFNGDGVFVNKWSYYGSDLAVDQAGYIYVIDDGFFSGINCIQKITSEGVLVNSWGSSGSGDGQFSSPRGIAVDSAGYVYVTDNGYYSRVQKFSAQGGTAAKSVIMVGNVVVGNPASSDWNCKVTDSATGTVISQFTLPAAGTSSSYTNTVELNSAGSYVVFEEPKLGYHTSIQINGSVVDSFQSIVNVDSGDNLQVLFTNTALASGSLDLPPPSDMNYSIPPLTLIPIQAAWNPDANNDGRLDMVVNKTMAVIINFTAPVTPSDIVTFSVKFDQNIFTKIAYGAILKSDSIVSFCPITPKNLGNKELNGTYQINNGASINFPSLTVAVKDTAKLPLYYGYLTRSNYGNVSQTSYSQTAINSTDFIKAAYPVSNVPANLNYNSYPGNVKVGTNQLGAKNDTNNFGIYAKTHFGENTNAIGIAIEPASYFTYHGFSPVPAGVTFAKDAKSVLVLEGGSTDAAHEVAHATSGIYIGTALEYYYTALQGTIVSGVNASGYQWRTGLDIMDYSSESGYNWVGTSTYNSLFSYFRMNLTDPAILIASGIIYKNGTVNLATNWYDVAQGIPDSIAPGNYALQFLAANGTVLGSISFDASPLDNDGTPFCFATTYPTGTAEVKVLSMADQSVPPKTLATVQAEDIVKINNGITFTQTGLPTGASWSVTLGSRTLSSTNSTIAFTGLASGSYNWNSSTEIYGSAGVRYAASVSSGTVDITGNLTKIVPYITQYQVSFAVNPVGAGNINPSSTDYYNAGSQVSISATANDQYQFLRWSSSNTSIVFSNAAKASTSATVNGPGTITGAFASTVGNSLAFTETGLPSEKSWSVTVGGQTLSSTSSAIVFTNLPSESYSWSASALISGTTGVRYAASTSSGTVTVAGQTSKAVTYTTQYQVSCGVNTAGAGTVNTTASAYYDAGSKVPISAAPKSGYNFWSWTTTSPSAIYFQSNSSASTTATINGPGTITANFAYVVTGNRNLVFTGANNVILVAGGNNVIDCRKATVTTIIKTGSGNNVIYLGEGDNLVKETASGNDIITSGNGNNNIDITGQGNYQITTGSGNDMIRITGDGNCIINVGDGDNQVTVLGKGNDQVTAGSGSDVIVSGDGNNIIKAGNGNNKVTVGKGNNQITTGAGSDEVTAGNGNNNIQTGAGDDKITVGSGNNYIDGGADYDICIHGTGKNTILNCEKGVM